MANKNGYSDLKMFYDADCDLNVLKGKKIAVIGYGSQGHAHSLCLRDSGMDVIVGLRKGGKSWAKAVDAGFQVYEIADAVKQADIVMILINDEVQAKVYKESIGPNLKDGAYVAFAHGFNIHFQQIVPASNINVFMVAPKGPGHTVRSEYLDGKGVPALYAVYQDVTGNTLDIALAYAAAIGAARAGVLETTFKIETETDLFGEQAVLCGGVTALMKAGFDTLVEAGFDPRNAYFECIHEMKLIVDLIYKGGFSMMRYSISDTAEYGDYVIGPRIINDSVKAEMKQVLKEIQDGTFALNWIAENNNGRAHFNAMRRIEAESLNERTGADIRALYSWNKPETLLESEKGVKVGKLF
ncbi:MAG: ketol-acid reductoisomerase [Clostridia bacterium]|nr:ketol-acid reductoisomerase [Clostridia bacterium]